MTDRVLTIIPTTSQRVNYTAIACTMYAKQRGTVVVMDQGQVEPLDGYVLGDSWIHTSNDNLLAQIDDGVRVAQERGFEYVTLLDDDIMLLSMIEGEVGTYRVKSRRDAILDEWKQELTAECLAFIETNIDDLFEADMSMLVISSRLFFPKKDEEIPYVTPLPLDRFPSVFNDHVVWKTDKLVEVLEQFRNLGILNYSAGVDKAGAVVNNFLGNRVGRLQWVRASKKDISGNINSTIYDFGDEPEEWRNLTRNLNDAESLLKLAPLLDGTGYALEARLTRNGTLNGFVRRGSMSLAEMVRDYQEKARSKILL